MALALGTHVSAHAESAGSVTTSAITISAGSLIVIGTLNYDGGGSAVDSVSASIDGSATLVSRSIAVGGFRRSALWYIKASAGGSQTFTYTVQANDFPRVFVLEFSGADTTAPLDQNTTATVVSGASLTATGLTTTAANEVLVTVAGDSNTNDSQTFADGGCATASGFTGTGTETQDATGNGLSGAMAYSIVVATGTYCVKMTAGGGASDMTMAFATFIAAAGAAGLPDGTRHMQPAHTTLIGW